MAAAEPPVSVTPRAGASATGVRPAAQFRISVIGPLAGQTRLVLAEPPTGWRAGDHLVLPDTRQLGGDERGGRYQPQWEELTVAAVSGETVTLSAPLAFDHKGARRPDGVLEFLPHVGNLTRNVVIRSANPRGVRGHVL